MFRNKKLTQAQLEKLEALKRVKPPLPRSDAASNPPRELPPTEKKWWGETLVKKWNEIRIKYNLGENEKPPNLN